MRLEGKKILISGGATGIGAAAAIYCASEGAQVVIADVNTTDAEIVIDHVKANGGTATFVKTDVSDENQVKSLVAEAENAMGSINGLVTAAGIATDSLTSIDEVALESWERLMGINMRGSFLTAKHTVPAMRRSGGGVIIMIASGAGVSAASSSVPYGASKGGVNGMAMTLAPALARDKIRVNALCPGNISTPLKLGIIDQQVDMVGEAANKDQQVAGLGTPEGVAKVLGLLLSDEAAYIRGPVFTR